VWFQTPPPPPPSNPEPPSIVVCILDDVSWQDLEAAETPAMDALCAEGLSYDGFHTMPVCSSTRLALWTGRLPRRMGVGEGINHYKPPGPENPSPGYDLDTLPRVLSSQGYSTCLVGKWHAGTYAVDGEARPEESALAVGGFDRWLAGTPGNLRSKLGKGYDLWYRIDDGEGRMSEEYPTAAQVDAATRWWKGSEGPKFLALSLNVPHAPFHTPPEEWRRKEYPPQRSGRFLEMLEGADLAVQAIVDLVDENTWFFVVSDNGTPPAINGAGSRGKSTTYDRGVRVPMIVRGPGVAESAHGQRTAGLVMCTDLHATLAEIAGAPARERRGGEDSVSFAASFREGAAFVGRPFAFSERFETNQSNRGTGDELMIRDQRWKLRRDSGLERFYDLTQKPFERTGFAPTALEGEAREAYERLLAHLMTLPVRNRSLQGVPSDAPGDGAPGRGGKKRRQGR